MTELYAAMRIDGVAARVGTFTDVPGEEQVLAESESPEAPEAKFTDEAEARTHVLRFCGLSGFRCIRCGETRAYALKDGRRRCATCQFTYHDLTGRWINRAKLSCSGWIDAIELFVDGAAVHRAAKELGVAYNTAFKAFRTIRLAIFHHAANGTPWPDSLFRYEKPLDVELGPPEAVRNIVFVLRHDGEAVTADPLPDIDTQEVLARSRTKTATGGIVFTGRVDDHANLIFCETSKILTPLTRDFVRGRIYLRENPFWQFALTRINGHHRISPRWFPFYLSELLFRYNTPDEDLASEVLRCLCCFIPQAPPGLSGDV